MGRKYYNENTENNSKRVFFLFSFKIKQGGGGGLDHPVVKTSKFLKIKAFADLCVGNASPTQPKVLDCNCRSQPIRVAYH